MGIGPMGIDLTKTSEIGGFVAACLVDSDTGLMLTSQGGGGLDLEQASALNAAVIKAKLAMVEGLGLDDRIEEVAVTLGKQLHLMRPLTSAPNVFLCVILEREKAVLGLARLQVREIEEALSL